MWRTMIGLPVLLLTTTGRKSGRPHTNPVVYLRDGDDYLIAASYGGADKHPTWYLNLKKNPAARIEIDGKQLEVKAAFADGPERAQLYERFKASSGNFVKYELATNRPIPVVRLTLR
jgi:deazaflavin-dependent oxidoreductase (nitroreductase family)